MISIPFTEFIYATLPRTQRGQPIVLGGDPKGVNFLYTNGNSVIIRNIEVSWKFIQTNLCEISFQIFRRLLSNHFLSWPVDLLTYRNINESIRFSYEILSKFFFYRTLIDTHWMQSYFCLTECVIATLTVQQVGDLYIRHHQSIWNVDKKYSSFRIPLLPMCIRNIRVQLTLPNILQVDSILHLVVCCLSTSCIKFHTKT